MRVRRESLDSLADRVLAGHPRPYLMAHRGNRVRCPENTMAAFHQALEDGAAILETDIHVTADGELVCIHDDTLDRTTDGEGAVCEYTLQELKHLRANRGFDGFSEERIPTLRELAGILPENIALALELKSDAFLIETHCRRLVETLDEADARHQALVISFSMDRLRVIRQVAPDIPVGLISLSRLFPARGPDFVGVLWPVLFANPFYVWLAHRRGQFFCPLDPTPDSRIGYYRFLGCDAVLSDDPAATMMKIREWNEH